MHVAQVEAQLRSEITTAPSCYNFIADVHELDVGALFRIIYRFIARLVLLDAFHKISHGLFGVRTFIVGLRGTAVAARRGRSLVAMASRASPYAIAATTR